MYVETNSAGLGQTSAVAILNQLSNTPGGWIAIFLVGFVIFYALTPQRYESAKGKRITKQQYYAEGGE